jgi:hypothetical protein
MLAYVKSRLSKLFDALIRNRVTEQEIREWFTANGFDGDAATISDVEIHAIARPGWLQVFRFEAVVRTAESPAKQLFGACCSDERFGSPEIAVFESCAMRGSQLELWSEGLIVRKRRFSRKAS